MIRSVRLLVLVFCLIVMAIEKTHAQPSIEWQTCFGGNNFEFSYAMELTPDGGYILACNTNSISGLTGFHGTEFKWDAWVFKLDSNRSVQWEKCYGSAGTESVRSI